MKLHHKRIAKLITFSADGMTVNNACLATGICRKTYYLWYNQGKADSENDRISLQRDMYDGLPVAQAFSLLKHIRIINEASLTDWRASAWFLERTRPAQYGHRKQAAQIDEDKNGPEGYIIGYNKPEDKSVIDPVRDVTSLN